jgi:hypothetical protein
MDEYNFVLDGLKEIIDIASDEDLKEAVNYINKILESRNLPGKASLDEVMEKLFEKYPKAKYFDFGMYGKGDYECAGECYTEEGVYDYDEFFLQDDEHKENDDFANEIPGYSYAENWLNSYFFGDGEGSDYDLYDKAEDEIKNAKGYPVINEARSRDLPNGTCMHVIYVKGNGIKEIVDNW